MTSARRLVTRLSGVTPLLLMAVLLLAAAPAPAAQGDRDVPSDAERGRIMDDVSGRVMCPSCGTTLANSDSPAADRMREYIDARISQGWTADRIVDGLVVEYGGESSILAAPPTDTGRGRLAWGVPLAVALAALVGGALSVRKWRRGATATRP